MKNTPNTSQNPLLYPYSKQTSDSEKSISYRMTSFFTKKFTSKKKKKRKMKDK